MHVFVTKNGENLFVIAEVLIILRRRRVSANCFHASNSFKMGHISSSSGSSSSSSLSGSSSDSLSSSSVSSSSETTPDSGAEIVKTYNLKVDEIKVILELYANVQGNSCENEDEYIGLEYGIILACHYQLYAKFPLMMSGFSEFAV